MAASSSWVDSHAHLTMFDSDEVGDVLVRAADRSVGGVLVPTTGADDLDAALTLHERFPEQIVVAVGVHPHEATSLDATLKRRVEAALEARGVVAVGEIGLDYHYMSSPREDQLSALAWQLDLALESGRPVVIHNRESWSDLEELLGERAGQLRGVCHSFTEGAAQAREVVAMGLLVGVSGMITFANADNIRDMAAALDASHVVVETDSPFLAPVPHRGRRNEPAFVVQVGKMLAEVWRADPAVIAARTTDNFRDLFGVPASWPGRFD